MCTCTDDISILISVLALIISSLTFLYEVWHARKVDTLSAFNTLQEQVLDDLAKYSNDDIKRIAAEHNSEEYILVASYLARLEQFAKGVQLKIYDKKVVRAVLTTHLFGVYDKLKPIIDVKRKRGRNEKLYRGFEELVIEMKREIREA